MQGGLWHVVLVEGRYIALWVADRAEVAATPETYLVGGYVHEFDALASANAANLLIGDNPSGERAAALRRIVEGVR